MKGFLTTLFFLASATLIFGQTVAEAAAFIPPSARANGFGGRHPALADDFYSLFANPAGLATVENTFSIAEVTASVHDVLNLVTELGILADPATAATLLATVDPLATGPIADVAVDSAGPLSLGWVGRNFGIALFNRTRANMPLTISNVYLVASEEVALLGGYSWRLVDYDGVTFDLGVLAKAFFRGDLLTSRPLTEANMLFQELTTKQFSTQIGGGIDIGIRCAVADWFSAGLVIHDPYSPVMQSGYTSLNDFTTSVAPVRSLTTKAHTTIDLGAAFTLSSDAGLNRYIITLDVHDALSVLSDSSRALNILGVGFEITLDDVLSIRLGFADMQPTVGLGLDFPFMKLDIGGQLDLQSLTNPTPLISADIGLLFHIKSRDNYLITR